MVTNPATRDWTVTASVYATLNEMYGNRTVCGIGRGDSAVRVTNGKPTTLATLREAVHVIRELANGRSVDYKGSTLRFPWAADSRLEVWVAGVRAEGAGARPARSATGSSSSSPTRRSPRGRSARCATPRPTAGRDPDDGHDLRRRAGLRHGDDLAHARDQCRWFGGMVGNHVADIVARYGDDGGAVPQALTDYIKGREGYDYNEHGQAGNTHTAVRARRDRRPLLHPRPGRASTSRRLEELRDLGVDQFAIYLQHDDKDAHARRPTARQVIPAIDRASAGQA